MAISKSRTHSPPTATAESQSSSPTLTGRTQDLTTRDVEKQGGTENEEPPSQQSAFKGLGLLDRFLAVWIFLAMAIGIILGNFVENTGPALQKGKFVGVSIPIGIYSSFPEKQSYKLTVPSYRSPSYDVPYPLQSTIRIFAPRLQTASNLGSDWVQHLCELDYCSLLDGKMQTLN